MNTNNLKKVAPRARTAFIKAITARAGEFGITAKGVSAPTVSGDVLQVAGFTHPARFAPAITRLQERVANEGFTQLIEQMAYTWFNRFCAIRFMELKSEEGYLEHGVRLLSHPTQPQGFEVLDRAPEVIESLMGEGVSLDKSALLELMLAGNEQEALFRELLLGQCHRLHQAMPFLFEAIDDETELLLPTGLTRTDAFWRELVDGIPEEDWTQVEVIGWLYQFYISEKKEQVIGKVVKSEDIPAATQLFTPNWIVQYLVQNSVGRYWLQTYPDSPLQQAMPYYVASGEQPDEVLAELAQMTPASIEPESIKVLDPACGSGHILVEAYNLIYRIYEERGYRSREIPQLILIHNLFGLDIDDRAAQLAGFALLMRARQDDRRLFSRDIALNIHALQPSGQLNIAKLWQALNLNADWDRGQVQDLFATAPATLAANDARLVLLNDLHLRFLSAKTLGSLIEVPAEQAPAIAELAATLHSLSISGDAMQKPAAQALLPLLKQASVLVKRYDAVIANPPYMGSKGMNAELKEFAKKQFPDSKSDLFAMFMESGFDLLKPNAFHAMVTMQSWMFLSSYENLRIKLLNHSAIECMAHMANMVMGIAFGTAATVCRKGGHRLTRGGFCYVEYEDIDDNGRPKQFPPLNERNLKAVKQGKAASEQGE
ncbi:MULTISPECIES: BREX-1 system adenine-specific DNA-methyltransferase PglX [unclassified Aeromonas]|uniref:BREX-1 system adenine-specific DNA-methyltransferase PglX n=1 Tax=Aeromonas TaxID=642 RepID=UPI003528E40B